MRIFRIIFQFIFSLAFAVACWLALAPFFAAVLQNSNSIFENLSYLAAAFVILLVTLAPTFRRSLGRGFLLLSVCLFLLPVSTTFLSVEVGAEMVENLDQNDGLEYGATVVGAAIGGTAVALVSGFFGFFLGTVTFILGLVLSLGGRREVVVVEQRYFGERREPTFTRSRESD